MRGGAGKITYLQAPPTHSAVTVPLKPVSQTGVQMVPLAEPGSQFPGEPLVTTGAAGQAVLTQAPVMTHAPEVQVAKKKISRSKK